MTTFKLSPEAKTAVRANKWIRLSKRRVAYIQYKHWHGRRGDRLIAVNPEGETETLDTRIWCVQQYDQTGGDGWALKASQFPDVWEELDAM